MSIFVRDGKFDVVVAAGPRVPIWPSVGVRALSSLCADFGLTVGLFGGETVRARGVIPLSGTGGIMIAEDLQGRIHRIQARAVVRFSAQPWEPEPFTGWRSKGLIPLATAKRLRAETQVLWEPSIAILGTGNAALRFGSELLESGTHEVRCIETHAQWAAKRFAGWEVERRRFEMAGGRLIEAKPVKLSQKSAQVWELVFRDIHGEKTIEVARVVSAGPFADLPGVREYPPGSLLFDFVQSAGVAPAEDVGGWITEEERGKWLGGKIARMLAEVSGARREELDKAYRRARTRLKRYGAHREEPFHPTYQGKWMLASDSRRIREFVGVPREVQRNRLVASIECVEAIGCTICQQACPESAIQINRQKNTFLVEADCTACGACMVACPSATPVLLQERDDRSTSTLVLPWKGKHSWSSGELVSLVNRRGESLGSGRVIGPHPSSQELKGLQLVQIEAPTHLIWEARAIRAVGPAPTDDDSYLAAISAETKSETVEITFDGDKRLVRDKIPVSAALFETGRNRAEDALFCPDGSCGLCQVMVDGVKKLACQTQVRRGMAIRLEDAGSEKNLKTLRSEDALCPCLDVTSEQVLDRLEHGKFHSPESLLSVTHVGEGRCRGQCCMENFRRLLVGPVAEVDQSQWIDWRFPWSTWALGGAK